MFREIGIALLVVTISGGLRAQDAGTHVHKAQQPATKKNKPADSMPGMDMSKPMDGKQESATPQQPATPAPAKPEPQAEPQPKPAADSMPGMDMSKPASTAEQHKTEPQQKPAETMPGMDMSKSSADSGGKHGMTDVAGHFSSGTAWQPASSPAYMWMWDRNGWMLSAHANVFLTFNHQGGPRGVGKLESMNWVMLMQSHALGKGQIEFREMLSAEGVTAPHGGFPQLFQTGETYRGKPIVDAQHPHDLFGELAATYTVPLGEKISLLAYAGLVGEPALGPVAFMHRMSASELPAAPLGHHLQDSTHISAGVLTGGLSVHRFKFEGSVFNGQEPDERRQTIDFAPLESWAVRASFAPNANWTGQYSYGHLVHPEAIEPGNIDRQTASVSYNRPLEGQRGNWATTVLWGRNRKQLTATTQNSYLLESTLNFAARNYAFTRMELVDKDELFPAALVQRQFRIGAFTFGGARDLVQSSKWQLAVGAATTFYSKPGALDAAYSPRPVSFQIFLRVRPGKSEHGM